MDNHENGSRSFSLSRSLHPVPRFSRGKQAQRPLIAVTILNNDGRLYGNRWSRRLTSIGWPGWAVKFDRAYCVSTLQSQPFLFVDRLCAPSTERVFNLQYHFRTRLPTW